MLDRALGRIGQAQGVIAAETSALRQQIAKLEAGLAARIKPQQDEILRLGGLIKTYAGAHRGDLFGKAKSAAGPPVSAGASSTAPQPPGSSG